MPNPFNDFNSPFVIIWLEWASQFFNLSNCFNASPTIGLVTLQIGNAINISCKDKGPLSFFNSRIGSSIVGDNNSILSGILDKVLITLIINALGADNNVDSLPVITLPFISYGGSSLLSYMLLVGILLNISVKKKSTYKYK